MKSVRSEWILRVTRLYDECCPKIQFPTLGHMIKLLGIAEDLGSKFAIELSCCGPFTRRLLVLRITDWFYTDFTALAFFGSSTFDTLWKIFSISVVLTEKQLNKQLALPNSYFLNIEVKNLSIAHGETSSIPSWICNSNANYHWSHWRRQYYILDI